ncbi:hypothetical protein [Stigmatella hybrida]|uniref:hypothetical protein n=1 Tax=Stigmatella hybrida TaxID=394097 RepID=UPI001CDA8770|nr:hypothetical protein [Stigmatella hybrida]
MTPSIETALIALAVSQPLVPLLNGLLARRQTKHEQAVDQVPLLVPSSRGGAGAGGGEPRLCRDGGGAGVGAVGKG